MKVKERNRPCPCGSGLKAKKCDCRDREAAAKAAEEAKLYSSEVRSLNRTMIPLIFGLASEGLGPRRF